MKNWKTIVALGVVLLILGGLATWDEWQNEEDLKAKDAKISLSAIKPADVVEIFYTTRPEEVGAPGAVDGVLKVHLKKIDGTWSIVAPLALDADNAAVESLMKSVTEYKFSKSIATGKSVWSQYGLDPAKTEVSLVKADGSSEVLYFGNQSPVGYDGYSATSRSDEVLIGSQHILTAAQKSLYDFRNKSFVRITEGDIKSLSYMSGFGSGAEIHLAKSDGKYVFANDTTTEADTGYVRDFIEDLNFVRVDRFDDDPDQDLLAKFSKPEVTVAMTFVERPELRLFFVASNDKMFAQIDGEETVFELPADFARKIQKKPSDFRNRRIVDASFMAAVTNLTIDGTTYKKVDGNWYTGEELRKAEDPKVDSAEESASIRPFMVDLEFAKTDDFYGFNDPDFVAATSDAPEHRIVLEDTKASGKKVTVELYKHALQADKFWVKVSSSNLGYLVSKSHFDSVIPSGKPEDSDRSFAPSEG